MISFIVPAHNEERLIADTLRAIHASGVALGEPYEVIVAADACTDRTAELAEEQGCQIVRVELRQISATRNSGARVSHGEILIFVDADTWITPEAARTAVETLRAGAVAGGFLCTFDGVLPLWWRLFYPPYAFLARLFRLVGGGCLFCTRTAFETIGEFSEKQFAAEEMVFIREMKKLGPFVIPRPTIVTSGRKLRECSGLQILGIILRVALFGEGGFQSRKGLEIWYADDRREAGDRAAPGT